jgi:hypothetical protein
MSGTVLAFYLLLIVVLVFQLSSNARRKPLQTLRATSVDEAISKVKELYPNAVYGRWQTDSNGWLPAGEVMCIWENQEALDCNSPPIAKINSYTP